MKRNLAEQAIILRGFVGEDLTATIGRLESDMRGLSAKDCSMLLTQRGVERNMLAAAAFLKEEVRQINVAIHALGILLCLPHILEEGEQVEGVSLGAGNTNREFDLVTSRRVAEFKFARWRGRREAVRQNGVFVDFYSLAEHPTSKRKELYVLSRARALKFLQGKRAMTSVLRGHAPLLKQFQAQFGGQFGRVGEYFRAREGAVEIIDVDPSVADLLGDVLNDGAGGVDSSLD